VTAVVTTTNKQTNYEQVLEIKHLHILIHQWGIPVHWSTFNMLCYTCYI